MFNDAPTSVSRRIPTFINYIYEAYVGICFDDCYGSRIVSMRSAVTGEMEPHMCIPMLHNGIYKTSRGHWRWYLTLKKIPMERYASHMIYPYILRRSRERFRQLGLVRPDGNLSNCIGYVYPVPATKLQRVLGFKETSGLNEILGTDGTERIR